MKITKRTLELSSEEADVVANVLFSGWAPPPPPMPGAEPPPLPAPEVQEVARALRQRKTIKVTLHSQ